MTVDLTAAELAELGDHRNDLRTTVERIVRERVSRALHDAADELARKGHRSAVARVRSLAPDASITADARYEEAPSGIKGDVAYRCLECQTLVANRREHDKQSHAEA